MSAGVCVERQTGETCGKSIFHPLAGDLQSEFPGISGFSVSSLRGMKNLYEAYRSSEKLAPLVREISWSHNSVILKHTLVTHLNDFLQILRGDFASVGNQCQMVSASMRKFRGE